LKTTCASAENDVRLRNFSCNPGHTFIYLYDFGDCWLHTVEIEQVVVGDANRRLPTCVVGARARRRKMWMGEWL
jgi:hypothetical protein